MILDQFNPFLPFLDDDGPFLRVIDPILIENTQKHGVKSEKSFVS